MKTVMLLNIFVETMTIFFQDSLNKIIAFILNRLFVTFKMFFIATFDKFYPYWIHFCFFKYVSTPPNFWMVTYVNE